MKRLILASLLGLASIGAHAASMVAVCYSSGGGLVPPVTSCPSVEWHNPGLGQAVLAQSGAWVPYSTSLSVPILTCNAAKQPGAGSAQSTCAAANQVYIAPTPAVAKTFSIPITWSNPTTDSDGNTVALTATSIYRGTSATTLVLVKTITPPATSYIDAGLVPGTYFYGVTATDAAGESDKITGSITLTITAGVPMAPTNLVLTSTPK